MFAGTVTPNYEVSAMFLRNMIFYTVLGGVLWTLGDRLGAGLGINLALSLLVPPLLIISYTVYKNRGPLL
jgi:hypothetical protein